MPSFSPFFFTLCRSTKAPQLQQFVATKMHAKEKYSQKNAARRSNSIRSEQHFVQAIMACICLLPALYTCAQHQPYERYTRLKWPSPIERTSLADEKWDDYFFVDFSHSGRRSPSLYTRHVQPSLPCSFFFTLQHRAKSVVLEPFFIHAQLPA